MGLHYTTRIGDRVNVVSLLSGATVATIELGRRWIEADCIAGYTVKMIPISTDGIDEISLTEPAKSE